MSHSDQLLRALQMIQATQAAGGVCAYIDTRHVLDTMMVLRAGVVLVDLLISQPDTATMAAEIVDTLIRTGAIDLIVIDAPLELRHHPMTTTTVVHLGHCATELEVRS
jgi:RecA/RadA recombinase